MTTLLVVIVLLYVFQCLCWTSTGAFVFSLRRAGRRRNGFRLSAIGLTAYWANPLPPLQPLVVVEWPGFQPEPEALTVEREAAAPLVIPWDQLKVSASSGKLLCNGTKVFQGGAEQARAQLAFLSNVRQSAFKKRAGLIDRWLSEAVDFQGAQDRWEQFRRRSRWLFVTTSLQFVVLFVAVPAAFSRLGTGILWPAVSAVLFLSWAIVFQFLRLHRLFFSGDRESRFKSVLSTVLSPLYAIRAGDALARDLFAAYHPLAVISVLCTREELERRAGEQLRANRYGDSGARWYSEHLQLALTEMLRKQEISAASLLGAPPQGAGCVMYCPRCQAQYTKPRAECADCGYAELQPFATGDTMAKNQAPSESPLGSH